MYRPKDEKERVLHRLKIIQGHLKKVMAMVENDQYCIDVLHQSQAIQSALRQFDSLTLKKHLQSCVVEDIKQGKIETSVEEIMKVFNKSNSS